MTEQMVAAGAITEPSVTSEGRTEVERMAYRTGQYLRRAGVMVVDGPDGRVGCMECQREWHPTRRSDGRFVSWTCPRGCSRARVAALDSLGLQPMSQPGVTFSMNTMPVIEHAPEDFTELFKALAGAFAQAPAEVVTV